MTAYRNVMRAVTDPNSTLRGIVTYYPIGDPYPVNLVPYTMKRRSDGKLEITITDLKGERGVEK